MEVKGMRAEGQLGFVKTKILTCCGILFSAASITMFMLPFVNIKGYPAISGFKLILGISRRITLIPLSGKEPGLVLISKSLPLLFSLLLYFLTACLFVIFMYMHARMHMHTQMQLNMHEQMQLNMHGNIQLNMHEHMRRMYKGKNIVSNMLAAASALACILYGVQLSGTGISVVEFFAVLLVKQQTSDGSTVFTVARQEVTTGIGARLFAVFGMLAVFAAIGIKLFESIERSKRTGVQAPWIIWFRQFKRNKPALLGVFILIGLAIFCFYGPVFSNYALLETNVSMAKKGPGTSHLLGTDAVGRDILTRLMYGGRISLTVGFAAVLLEVLIGASIGAVSGYFGGSVDNVLMRVVDIFLSIPYLPIVIILGAIMSDFDVPPRLRIYFVMLILGFLGWPSLARLVRGQVLSLRQQEFMLAAEALGLSARRKIFRHLVPNVTPQVIASATLGIGAAILNESALSFLGLGVAMPYPSWGNMIQAVRNSYDFAYRAWLWIPPGLCIFITVLAVNFVGDGLRDALEPRMKL
jgi:peptide/nickel transport system permease protein